ncbi:MAG: ABC-F family ATP-binding cassette domain-containing protein [Candidatus Altimarinota bacterium]
MIRITDLNKFYGNNVLFSDVSLTIDAKEKIGLIGRNGSGKSTFLKLLQHPEDADGAIQTSTNLIISSLEQDLNFEQPTLHQQACSALSGHNIGQDWKAESILMGLGFRQEDFQKAPKDFSSGFQIRIRLAEALIKEPHLLLLDEPTNYLDILTLRWLSRFLKTWQNAFLLVTHDRHFMEEVVTHTVAIHRGKMRKMKGGPRKLMDQIFLEEEVYERTRVKQEKKKEKTEEFIRKFRAKARSAGMVQSRIKALEKQDIGEKLEKLPEIRFHFQSDPFHGDSLLKAHNLNFSYPDGPRIIRDFSLTTTAGDRIAIIGRNGKGKSTLLKLLSEQLTPQSGKLKTHPELKKGSFGSDSKDNLHPNHTILEELRKVGDVKEQEVRDLCGALLFPGDDSKKEISKLSGGEKSRVCLGKVILKKTHLLFLDEPTNHLDMESCDALIEALKKYKGTVIFVSHDEDMLSRLANRLIVFDRGEISVKEQGYEEFLQTEGWSEEEDEAYFLFKRPSDNKKRYEERKEQQKRLRWVTKRQGELSERLEHLEQGQRKTSLELHEACEQKDPDAIRDLGIKAKFLAEEVEDLYRELEALIEEEKELLND